MGCFSSTPKVDESKGGNAPQSKDDDVAKRRAEQQRRRLSVAPQHVGDITVDQDGRDTAAPMSASPSGHVASLDGKGVGYRYAEHSKKGFVPYNRNKQNQDRFVVDRLLIDDTDVFLYGVCDGHGEQGHLVSDFVKKNLSQCLKNRRDKLINNTPEALSEAVDELANALKGTSINTAFSGTTAVFSVVFDGVMFTANIGDSRCVKCVSTGDGWKSTALSEDHKPDNPMEMARIIKAGGRVEPLPGLPNEDRGPHRVWLKEVDVPGLAMSRSIGDDVSHSVGVVYEPEVRREAIADEDLFVIWASDGVWEFITNESACKLIYKNVQKGDLEAAAKELVHESVRQWQKEEEVVDDITVVIVKLRDF